jgi:hypothetical protein
MFIIIIIVVMEEGTAVFPINDMTLEKILESFTQAKMADIGEIFSSEVKWRDRKKTRAERVPRGGYSRNGNIFPLF